MRCRTIGIAAVLFVMGLVPAPAVAGPDCSEWNTAEFFEKATVADVTRCLKAGADPNARDENDFFPLAWAVLSNENPAATKVLLDAGADPKSRSFYGYTILHVAARHNTSPVVVNALIDAGADPNARKDGYTPLHAAAQYSTNPAVIEALLDAGADPSAKDTDGKYPLDYADDRRELKERMEPDVYWRLYDGRFNEYNP